MKISARPVSLRCYSYHHGPAVFFSPQDIKQLLELLASIEYHLGPPLLGGHVSGVERLSRLLDEICGILGEAETRLRHLK